MDNIKRITKDILKEIGIIFTYIILNISLELLLAKSISSTNIFTKTTSLIFIELIVLIVFISIFKKSLIPQFYDFIKNHKKYISDNLKYWLLGLSIMAVSNFVIQIFIDIPTNESNVQDLLRSSFMYYIIAALIVAPIVEELMTRKILKDTFKHKIIYYFISGFIFGLLHLLAASHIYEIFYIIPYGALGYSFAVIYDKSNNIWTNIFFHFFHNLIATILSLLSLIICFGGI